MASPYQKGCLELTACLQKNDSALKMLHTIYKLPIEYRSLPASETVQAMELLGVISEENLPGLIDLPLVLGIKSSHKRIKKKLKGKAKYSGFSGVVKVRPNKDAIQKYIQNTYTLLQGQLEIMEMAMDASREESGLGEVLDGLNNVKYLIDAFLHRAAVSNYHDKAVVTPSTPRHGREIPLKVPAHKTTPIKYVRRPVEQTEDESEKRSTFDKIPTPTRKIKGIQVDFTLPSSQMTRTDSDYDGDDIYEEQEWSDQLGIKNSPLAIRTLLTPSVNHEKINMKELKKNIQQKSLGLPPSVAPKPTKSTANSTGLKVQLKPPLPQTLLPQPQIVAGHHVQVSDSNEALRNSSGYTVMKPPGNVNLEPLSGYANIGPSKKKQPITITNDHDNSFDTDDEYEEYETILNKEEH